MIPDNACIPRITAAAGTELADAYSSSTVRTSFLRKEVYRPKSFIPHAVLLRQAFAHCGKFPTAASRKSLDRVSVPVCLIVLSNQILIVALVSHYLTNKLISRKLLFRHISLSEKRNLSYMHFTTSALFNNYYSCKSIWGISKCFQLLSPS